MPGETEALPAAGLRIDDIIGPDRKQRLLRKGAIGLVVLAGVALAGALMAPPEGGGSAAGTVSSVGETAPPAQIATPVPLELRPARAAESWVPVRKPVAVFNLEGPETEGAAFKLQVFAQGRYSRQDILTWRVEGERRAGAARPDMRMIVERFEKDRPTHRPLFADIALRASDANASIQRMSPAVELPTKFGGFEVADAVVAFEAGPLSCLVFRRIDTIGLTIAGWYCGSVERPADRVSLGCFVNRLDLVSAGQDRALKRLFSEAELRRQGCRSARQTGRKMTWLDHDAPVPPLKLSQAIRR